MQKKILILDTGKEWGGGTNSLLELLRRVDKYRYKCIVLFYHNYQKGNSSNIKREIERLGAEFILLSRMGQPAIAKVLKEIGRPFLSFSRKLRKQYIFYIDYHLRIQRDAKKIAGIIKKLNIDLLYMNNQPSSNLEGILAAKMAGISCVQHSRIGAGLNEFEINVANSGLTKMICVSKGVKDMFIREGINESICEVVYNGIDPDIKPRVPASEIREVWGVSDNEVLIGTVGALVKRKRINDLIEAMARLQEKTHKPVKCLIVGEGPEMENLKKDVLKRELKGKVLFTGFRPEAISYINAMDIFVMPSEKEGLPRVILEAMLMARPVVACNVTGPSELIVDGKTGFLVKLKNPDMLADMLSRLIASADIRRQMGKNGRNRVIERFSIDSYVDGVSRVFEEVIGVNG